MGKKPKECTGKYGRLQAIRPAAYFEEQNGRLRTQTECLCDCGKIIIVQNQSLRNRATKSCGCIRSENMSKIATKHGLRKLFIKEYRAWCAMKSRCKSDSNYLEREIKVHQSWTLFETFLKDIGPCPEGDLISLDRINNDGDYMPGNCRWATITVQNNNRRPRRWAKKPPQQSDTKCS